jgi:transcriptional regulator GlxA family with amidase domain
MATLATPARRIAVLAFPDVQILDVVGPLEVFGRTARFLIEKNLRARSTYVVEILGLQAGAVRSSSGLELVAERAFSDVRDGIDTLLVAGGSGTMRVLENEEVLRWLRKMRPRVRRIGSVCTGAFVLAEAGMLDGRRATTHWDWCARFAARYPRVNLEPDPIFVKDGRTYTSAGVTAGMDLALSLVEEDHGREVALGVARELVVFLRRPGGQSQFSAQLSAQLAEGKPIQRVQTYIHDQLENDLSVPVLAARVAMSPRHFARVFSREVGVTPAHYVQRVRVEVARRKLEETARGMDEIASECGFGTAEVMRRAFLRTMRVPPRAYRERFREEEPIEAPTRRRTIAPRKRRARNERRST